MTRPAPAIVAAELRVVQSRRGLHQGVRRLRHRLTRPSYLAAAAAVGALLGIALTRRGRAGALAATLATVLIRYGLNHLVARVDSPRRIRPS